MGRRRNTRVFTFDLSSAHARTAFEDALDNDEFDVEDALHATRSTTQANGVLKTRNKRAQQSPGFHQADSSSTPGSSRQHTGPRFTDAEMVHLIDLVSLFGETHDKDLIQDVYASCHCSFEAALQVLSDMTTTQEIARAAAQADEAEGGSSQVSSFPVDPGVAWWDLLHESIKETVFSYLSARDLARVAWTCKDFAWRVRNGRMTARSLVIPAGVTLNSVLGMVAGHTNARAISLVRWGAAHLRDADFRALITAVAQGSCSSRRNVRVEALSLRGWSSASDSNMLTCLDTLRHLRELDLSDCSSLTDAALGPISRYQHEVDTHTGHPDDSDEYDEYEQEAHDRGPQQGGLDYALSQLSLAAAAAGTPGSLGKPKTSWAAATANTATTPAPTTTATTSTAAPLTPTSPAAAGTPPTATTTTTTAATAPLTCELAALSLSPAGDMSSPPAIAASVGGLGLLAGGMSGSPAQGTTTSTPVGGSASAASADKARRGAGNAPAWGRPPLGGVQGSMPVQGDEDEMSETGSQVAGDSDDEFGGVVLDEDLERRAARQAAAATIATAVASRPPAASAARTIPAPGGGAIHRSGSYSSASGTPVLSSSAQHGSGYGGLYGASPTSAAAIFGTSPPAFTSRSPSLSGSLGKGGSMGSLGKTMFSKFTGSASGGGGGLRIGTPPHGSSLDSTHKAGGSSSTQPASSSSGATGRGVEVLCLAGCSRISADGVKALLSAPVVKQCLHALDVSRCMRLTRAALVLPPQSSLRVLKAAECQNFHEISMQLPLNSPLQELWLNNCKHLTKLIVVAPRLTLLHVGGCKSLISLQLRCPRLTQLLANLCIKLSEIQADDITAPLLEEINMFGCRQMSSAALAAVLQGTPRLQLLNLNGCSMLTELHLPEHAELRSIDLTGCKHVTGVTVSSPQLTSLTARACHRLITITIGSPSLTTLDLTNCSALRTLELPALQPATSALSAHPQISAVLAARPRVHTATQDVLASCATRTQTVLSTLGVQPVHVRAPGCEGVPALVTLAFRVLKLVVNATQPKAPATKAGA